MAHDIGELRATLTIDGKQYEMGLKEASVKTKELDTDTANLATSIFVAQQAFNYGKEALTVYTDAMIGAYQEVKQFNAMTGMSIEQGGKWQDMMEGMGLSLSDVTMAFRILSNNIQQALTDPESGAATAFNRLGVALVDAQGNMKDSNAVLLETIDALQKIPAGTERNSLAMDTLGRSYMNLNKLLDNNKTATQLYGEAISSTTETGMEKFDKFTEAMNAFNDAVDDTKVGIGEGLLPMLTTFVNLLNTYVMPAVNAIGEKFQRIGFDMAAAFTDPLGFISGKYNDAYYEQSRFLASAKGYNKNNLPPGSKTSTKAPATSSGTSKENVVMKGIDAEIQANFESIARYLDSIETKKALDKDYTDDKEALLKVQQEQEILINKTTNQAYKDMWNNLKANIESNPVKALIDIQAGVTIMKGGASTSSGTSESDDWTGVNMGSPGSEMYQFMTMAKDKGYSYQEALNLWGSDAGGAGKMSLLTGISTTGRATGGPVMAGSPYMVGERGPEIFVPNTSGNIVSNGGVNIYVELDGETIAKKIAAPLVGEIRVRTGVRF
jgi:hypothetical protein